MARKRRIVNVKLLPFEPTDGSGRARIHLFVPDERGPFVEKHVLQLVTETGEDGVTRREIEAKPARGRLACDPKKTVAPKVSNGVTTVTMRSDDPRAVTCARCCVSDDYARMMAALEAAAK